MQARPDTVAIVELEHPLSSLKLKECHFKDAADLTCHSHCMQDMGI